MFKIIGVERSTMGCVLVTVTMQAKDWRKADKGQLYGVVVGLKAKGKAKKDTTGFVRAVA